MSEQTQCPLCGYKFDPNAGSRCSGCSLRKNCHIICCPHCGYGFVGESKLANAIRNWIRRKVKNVKS